MDVQNDATRIELEQITRADVAVAEAVDESAAEPAGAVHRGHRHALQQRGGAAALAKLIEERREEHAERVEQPKHPEEAEPRAEHHPPAVSAVERQLGVHRRRLGRWWQRRPLLLLLRQGGGDGGHECVPGASVAEQRRRRCETSAAPTSSRTAPARRKF